MNCKILLEWVSESRSVVSNSLWPHRLFGPWNSPGQNTGVGSCCLLQGIVPTQRSNPGLLHCRQILYHLTHQGSPRSSLQFAKYNVDTRPHSLWPCRIPQGPCGWPRAFGLKEEVSAGLQSPLHPQRYQQLLLGGGTLTLLPYREQASTLSPSLPGKGHSTHPWSDLDGQVLNVASTGPSRIHADLKGLCAERWQTFGYRERSFLSIHSMFSVDPTTQLREWGCFFSQHHSANWLSHPTGGALCWGQSWGPASRCRRSTNIHGARSAGGNLKVRSGLPQSEPGVGVQGWRQPPRS